MITWHEKVVTVDFNGIVSIEEVDQASQSLYKDPRILKCKYQLFNFKLADLSGITLEQVRNTAKIDTDASSQYPALSLAIVSHQATAEALIFHYKQTAEGSRIQWGIKSFRTTKDAYEWCNVILAIGSN